MKNIKMTAHDFYILKEEIASIIVQSPEPITAPEIAAHLIGVTSLEVSAFLSNAIGNIERVISSLGYRLYRKPVIREKKYVAKNNPKNYLNIKSKLSAYYAVRI